MTKSPVLCGMLGKAGPGGFLSKVGSPRLHGNLGFSKSFFQLAGLREDSTKEVAFAMPSAAGPMMGGGK